MIKGIHGVWIYMDGWMDGDDCGGSLPGDGIAIDRGCVCVW